MGGTRKLVEVPPGQWRRYYTISQVAALINRKPHTIKNWFRAGAVDGATHYGVRGSGAGEQYVWLYTRRDVQRLKRFARESKERQGNRGTS